MKLNEKIIFYRKKCGMSQEELGDMIGVSRQAVSKWETGDALPEVTKLKALADVFGVTVDHLLSEDDENNDQGGNATSSFGQDYLNRTKENSGETQNDASSVKTHSSGNGTADRLELFLKRYAWVGGVLLILYGVYRFVVGAITLLNTISMFGATGVGSAGLQISFVCLYHILIGIAFIVGGAYVLKKFKRTSSVKRERNIVGKLLVFLGVFVVLIGLLLLCNAFGALDVIKLSSFLPTSVSVLLVSIIVLAISVALITAGVIMIKKSKAVKFD